MLWFKTFHIFFVVSWFAGLFYLPRIFVNLALVNTPVEAVRLLMMANKLYRFITPIGLIAVALGLILWFGFNFVGDWLYVKTALVALLLAYHFYCGRLLRAFAAGQRLHSHVWYRVFNELPVLLLLAVTLLAVLKPF